MKKTKIKPISEKRRIQLGDFLTLRIRLTDLCKNKSELSNEKPDWQSGFLVEAHHITNRIGKQLLNPFGIIMLTRDEHTIEQQHKEGCHTKEELLNLIRDVRISQGFKEDKNEQSINDIGEGAIRVKGCNEFYFVGRY